jgi:2-dehydro-3-deoxyphosphogluconate aldolase/(4S)-4-hydroxy-2-oxoglutarate aldolase
MEKIKQIGIIPVVVIDELAKAVQIAKALNEGGIPLIEVTFRTECAAEAIKQINAEYPDMLIGAGTVITLKQAENAIKSGAKFIVAPGFNKEIALYCEKKEIPYIPGCITPTEIEMALSVGIKIIKYFPAEAAGGLKMIKALSAPYKDILFIPTGGIDMNNLKEYISFNKVIACGGSFMVTKELIDNEQFNEIKNISQNTVALIKESLKE